LILIILFYILKNKKNKKRLEDAKAKKELLEHEYQNIKNLNRIHQESIEHKSQELASGMMSLSTVEGNISRLITLCKENPADLYIDNIKGQLQSLTTDKDYWTLFRKRFNETYKNFQINLEANFPELTKNDLFFCSLLKLNLPYKDMATLMQVSPETIVKKKYRIKKKLGIETEQELENILLNTSL
jgi:DNA-binding CsgD family transcriptional regulator